MTSSPASRRNSGAWRHVDDVDVVPVDHVDGFSARIIYTRFWTIAAVLLRRIKNQNTEDELHKLIVETTDQDSRSETLLWGRNIVLI